MPRPLHLAMLRRAALLVPASARAEWLAEWNAELCYVDHHATSFCLGSFRDALCLRGRNFRVGNVFHVDSPLRCALWLAGLAAASFFLAAAAHDFRLPASAANLQPLAAETLWLYGESLLVVLTLHPSALGEYPANLHAPSLLRRLYRWAFLGMKIALLALLLVFATAALGPIFPPAAMLLFFGLIFGLRWVIADQRRRCPVCLHVLSGPVDTGSPSHILLRPHGAEFHCARGHGSLFVPCAPTSWYPVQRWRYVPSVGTGRPS